MSVPFYIPEYENFEDYRDEIPGDSLGDTWPIFYTDTKDFLGIAIHHTAGPDNQTPDDIANFHIDGRGWGGIGYHFLIDKDGKIWYVGDLGTGRIHVAGMNHEYISVCMIGSFMDGVVPTDVQLQACHMLCKEFVDNEPDRFPNINDWEDIKPHGTLTSTACPGNTRDEWWIKIKYGTDNAEPCEDKLSEALLDLSRVTDERNRKDEKFEKAKLLAETMENKWLTEQDLHDDTRRKLEQLTKTYDRVSEENIGFVKTIALQKAEIEALKDKKYSMRESLSYFVDAFFRKLGGENK